MPRETGLFTAEAMLALTLNNALIFVLPKRNKGRPGPMPVHKWAKKLADELKRLGRFPKEGLKLPKPW